MFDNFPDVVNVDDIQNMLRICKSSAYQLVQDNIIASKRVGRRYIIPKQAVINYLTQPPECDIIASHSRLVTLKEDSN